MSKRIIYTRPDGGLTVVTPQINTHTLVDGEIKPIPEDISEAEAIERAIAKLPDYAKGACQIVDASVIPMDRTFRNAWKAGAGAIEHDMAKCRELHKDRLRALRAPKLQVLDAEYLRADEVGDLVRKAEIAAKKQALRDVTADPAIAKAETPEALKAVMPAALTS